MPSIERPLSGDVMVFDLEDERKQAADPSIIDRSGKNARTILKNGPLRTVVVLGAGGELTEHTAAGPITVQPLQGRIRFTAAGEQHEIGPGQLLSTAADIPHAVHSADGATFLLTIAKAEKEVRSPDD